MSESSVSILSESEEGENYSDIENTSVCSQDVVFCDEIANYHDFRPQIEQIDEALNLEI